MPAPRIGQIGQKYQEPVPRPTASHTVNTMTTMATYAARIVATELGNRQVDGELAQVGCRVGVVHLLQPRLVFGHVEVALG